VTYKRGQSKGSKSCSSIYTPGHHNNTLRYNQNLYTMSAEGQLHTAHAVVYQRTKAKQVLTTQDRRNGRPAYALQSPSAPLPRPRYADVRRLKGEELHKSHTAGIYAPRAEHRDSTLISQRILDWERESSDGSTVEDMQCSQTVSPIRTPADIPEQLVDIVAPSNELSPLSSPPDYQLPPPIFHFPVCEDEEPRCVKRSHSLEQRNTGENFTRMSPSSSLGYEDLGDHDVVYKDVNEGNLHSKSSESCLIKRLDRNEEMEPDYCYVEEAGTKTLLEQYQPQDNQEKHKWFQISKGTQQKWQNELPAWTRALFRVKRCPTPYYNNYFRKGFDFSPKKQGTKQNAELIPLSPCSSYGSVLEPSLYVQEKVSKRERYDSTQVDGTVQEWSEPTTARITIQHNPSSELYTTQSAEVHPGQLVDFTASNLACEEDDTTPLLASLHEHDGISPAPSPKAPPSLHRGTTTFPIPSTSPVHRPSYNNTILTHDLETMFNAQGRLRTTAAEAQAALDEQLRMRECSIQRRPRTTRDSHLAQPPGASDIAVPPRRGSLVERCESSDAFLKFVRDEARMGRAEHDGPRRT
jgi:hypothetical protein